MRLERGSDFWWWRKRKVFIERMVVVLKVSNNLEVRFINGILDRVNGVELFFCKVYRNIFGEGINF